MLSNRIAICIAATIDRDDTRAYRMQDQFNNQLLEAMWTAHRRRVSGLGVS